MKVKSSDNYEVSPEVHLKNGFVGETRRFPVILKSSKGGTNTIQFSVAGIICGCGAGQMSGFGQIFSASEWDDESTKAFDAMKSTLFKLNSYRAVVATLGQAHFEKPGMLGLMKTLGFQEVAEYPNVLHGPKYTQKMFVCKLTE